MESLDCVTQGRENVVKIFAALSDLLGLAKEVGHIRVVVDGVVQVHLKRYLRFSDEEVTDSLRHRVFDAAETNIEVVVESLAHFLHINGATSAKRFVLVALVLLLILLLLLLLRRTARLALHAGLLLLLLLLSTGAWLAIILLLLLGITLHSGLLRTAWLSILRNNYVLAFFNEVIIIRELVMNLGIEHVLND